VTIIAVVTIILVPFFDEKPEYPARPDVRRES